MTTNRRPSKIAVWIEAMRLRTLPVSVAGVLMATGLALHHHCFNGLITAICIVFAILAQIASNFANEYFDYKAGLDAPGREGPRRGVTEGDITPRAMLCATLGTLATACALGCSLIYWGGWPILVAGIAIALGVLAYSTGPYPLSHHGLGEVAVILFFGLAPVCLTYYLQAACIPTGVFMAGLATGLMGANVLIVNNYRDRQADKAVGKRTLAVMMGSRPTALLYLINAILAVALLLPEWHLLPLGGCIAVNAAYILISFAIYIALKRRSGHKLTPLLGMTAVLMLVYSLAYLISVCI